MSGKKKVSIASVIEIAVIILLVLIIAAMIAINVVFKNDGNAKPIFGATIYKTKAVNMVPEIPVNTVVIAKESEIENIRERSVILCKIGERTTLTRVVRIDNEDGKTFYVVKFDTSPATETFRIESTAVIAKAVWQLESFGKFLDFAQSTIGILLAIILPLLVIIIFQVIRIFNIRKLEAEADEDDDYDYADGIEDVLTITRDGHENDESAYTITKPKFIEDVTDKIPIPAYAGKKEAPVFKPEPRQEMKLNINAHGRAEYTANPNISNASASEDKSSAALFTYDRLPKKTGDLLKKAPPSSANSEQDDLYLNKPTRIESAEPKSKVDEFLDSYSPRGSKAAANDEQVNFTPHISNVIPDRIAHVLEEVSAPKQASFESAEKSYFAKDEVIESRGVLKQRAEDISQENIDTIPKNAVVPMETLAPPKKKKNSKTLDELMSFIDAEESKLKK